MNDFLICLAFLLFGNRIRNVFVHLCSLPHVFSPRSPSTVSKQETAVHASHAKQPLHVGGQCSGQMKLSTHVEKRLSNLKVYLVPPNLSTIKCLWRSYLRHCNLELKHELPPNLMLLVCAALEIYNTLHRVT